MLCCVVLCCQCDDAVAVAGDVDVHVDGHAVFLSSKALFLVGFSISLSR